MSGFRCPVCRSPVDVALCRCAEGHEFGSANAVPKLVTPDFGALLDTVELKLMTFRKQSSRTSPTPDEYERLPFSREASDPEWRQRAFDARTISDRLAGRTDCRVLDLGAWNGWLSHCLARAGHDVLAVDYFVDAADGLGAHRHYRARFAVAQIDLADLDVIDRRFDVVIVNHGLAFFTDPHAHVRSAAALLGPGGILFVLGLQFFRDTTKRVQRVEAMRDRYRAATGSELFFRPTRALLDAGDFERLRSCGLQFHAYPQSLLRRLITHLDRRRPVTVLGVATQAGLRFPDS